MSGTWNFTGRRALVTGGSRGIGAAIVQYLDTAGARVDVFDRAPPGACHAAATYHDIDITDAEAVAHAIASLPEPPLLLINNAGITRDRTLAKMSNDEWQTVLNVNLTGAFQMIRAVAPGMIATGYGRIVSLTSINGLRGKFGQANYAASKAGLIGLTKSAARELGPKGITVNAVAPGMVLTEMALAAPQEIRARAQAETVLGTLAEPSDIAQAVLFLLSDHARMITGEVLRVDAGQYL